MEESFRAGHILLDSLEDALEIAGLLDNGESFTDLAKEYSECDSSVKGGDLGSFIKGQMVPEFEYAFFQLKAGEHSRPVQTKYGFHIIYRIR